MTVGWINNIIAENREQNTVKRWLSLYSVQELCHCYSSASWPLRLLSVLLWASAQPERWSIRFVDFWEDFQAPKTVRLFSTKLYWWTRHLTGLSWEVLLANPNTTRVCKMSQNAFKLSQFSLVAHRSLTSYWFNFERSCSNFFHKFSLKFSKSCCRCLKLVSNHL